jgi:hypothetical protein
MGGGEEEFNRAVAHAASFHLLALIVGHSENMLHPVLDSCKARVGALIVIMTAMKQMFVR